MKHRVTVDKAGRKREGEEIMLSPARHTAPLRKERGIWVHRTGQPLASAMADSAIHQIREERTDAMLGKKRSKLL